VSGGRPLKRHVGCGAAGQQCCGVGGEHCYLQYGHTGDGVRALQKNVNSCYGKALDLDSGFGPDTRAALRDVQDRIGAAVDGVYGRETMLKMKWARYNNETGARHDCAYLP
jgi:peptidoglycan hydrolase-like protein with peptidoglycan-binding domain